MQSLAVFSFAFFFCHLLIRTSCQGIEGKYSRPNQPKFDKQGECFEDSDDKSHTYDADKHYPGDDYRSVDDGGRPQGNKVYKPGIVDDFKSGHEDFNFKPNGEEPAPKPGTGGGYNRKPMIDRDEYIPKPVDPMRVHNFKDDAFIPQSTGSDYNSKPVRGANNRYKPKPDEDIDHYIPKPIGGGYNPKPVEDIDPYIPKPTGAGYKPDSGDYVPRPIGGSYHLKPSLEGDDDFHKPDIGGSYRPKPVIDQDRPRPVSGGDYYNSSRPLEPAYPNKDLGRYYDSKDDDDFSHDIGVDEEVKVDEIVKEKNVTLVEEGVRGYYKTSRAEEPVNPNKILERHHRSKDDDSKDDIDVDEEVKKTDDDYYEDEKQRLEKGNCICVPHYQCQEGLIVTDGAGMINARKRPEPVAELPLDGKFKPPTCAPLHVCCYTKTYMDMPYRHRCGVREPNGFGSGVWSPVAGGIFANFGEWPWQAAVLHSLNKVNIFMCGGVLIDKLHVLTVAHCVFHLQKFNEYPPLKVRLGEWDPQSDKEFLPHYEYKVSKIIVHPEYRNTSLWNDVALLKLEKEVLFAPHIDTICLPKYDDVFAEQNCVVTGWGKGAFRNISNADMYIMREITLHVIDNYKCEEMLRKTRLGSFFQLHEGFLCAGEYEQDPCKEDGGGPLVCSTRDKSYALAGIVSWGIDCRQPYIPGVYVNIQKYLDWISKNTGNDLEEYWPSH